MIVVKIGGGKGTDYDEILRDIAGRKDVVIVHGGNYETSVISEKLGKPPRMVTSVSGHESRYTDRETLEIFEMVYCGKINKMIVEKLQKLGVNAVGLSGIDGRLFEGRRKESVKIIENGKRKILHDDFTGKAENVNSGLIIDLIEKGYMPVLTPPAISYEGDAINVDGDRIAALVAGSLKAETLVILSNVPGLLKDMNDEKSVIRKIDKSDIGRFAEYAKGRMKRKVLGAAEALDSGVGRVIIADGRVKSPVTYALAGNGTVIA
jgi:acetylglutamate/LysW-gamma-L-alpha-aminoadipate kinase